MLSGWRQRSPWQPALSLSPLGCQAGGYLWLAPSYAERPGLESPQPRVLDVLRASSHGTGGAWGNSCRCLGEQYGDDFSRRWGWRGATSRAGVTASHPAV